MTRPSSTSGVPVEPSPSAWALVRQVLSRRMAVCAALGFSSGLPLSVLVFTLPAWGRLSGWSLMDLGILSALRVPYVWKFVWSPLLDRYPLPWLSRRRDWSLASQVLLLLAIAAFALFADGHGRYPVMALTFVVALLGATQDIALDAYRRELLPDAELGLGNAIWVNAYRVAGFMTGGVALMLVGTLSWEGIFLLLAACMLVGVVTIWMAPRLSWEPEPPASLWRATVEPFQELFARGRGQTGRVSVWWLLGFMILYKLGDNLATAHSTPFYIDLGFSPVEIGATVKLISLWAMIGGGVVGGIVMLRIGINKALWAFGIVQMLSILGFAMLAVIGNQLWALSLAVGMEYVGVGLGTSAFVAFVARSTSRRFSATQMALFSSFVALPNVIAGPTAAALIEWLGYTRFFLLCTALALPGLAFLLKVAPWVGSEQEGGERTAA